MLFPQSYSLIFCLSPFKKFLDCAKPIDEIITYFEKNIFSPKPNLSSSPNVFENFIRILTYRQIEFLRGIIFFSFSYLHISHLFISSLIFKDLYSSQTRKYPPSPEKDYPLDPPNFGRLQRCIK